jgi:hypothetical protein
MIVYGEASKDGIRYSPPVELKVIPIMAAPENKSYNSSKWFKTFTRWSIDIWYL